MKATLRSPGRPNLLNELFLLKHVLKITNFLIHMSNFHVIDIPAGSFERGASIYAIVFRDRSIYVGHAPGNAPLQRLAIHFEEKRDRTPRVTDAYGGNARRVEAFTFCYRKLPGDLMKRSQSIENLVIGDLRKRKCRLLNASRGNKRKLQESPSDVFVKCFIEDLIATIRECLTSGRRSALRTVNVCHLSRKWCRSSEKVLGEYL